jgi:hypothetical protein
VEAVEHEGASDRVGEDDGHADHGHPHPQVRRRVPAVGATTSAATAAMTVRAASR